MRSNYPPGVTGNEYQIAGPDYERESETPCLECGEDAVLVQGYRLDFWSVCRACGWTTDIEHDDEPDPDRAHDEAVERRLFGEE